MAPSRATCQIWEARARGATRKIPQTQRIRSVAREGKRKFEFLSVTDAEVRKHRGNPTGECRYEFQKRREGETMKADKMYFLYVHSCGFSPPLSYSESCSAPLVCVCRMHRYVSLSRLPLLDNISRHDRRSISMSIDAERRRLAAKTKACKNAQRLAPWRRKTFRAFAYQYAEDHNAL